VLLAVLSYGVLLSQLFFGPLLLNTYTRRVVVTLAVVVNLLIAVVFGQPWSSASTIAVTLLFVSDATWQRVEDVVLDVSQPATDWLIERGYDVVDRLDDVKYRAVYPVVDWFRFTILRRR
jgi:hypothetical protein